MAQYGQPLPSRVRRAGDVSHTWDETMAQRHQYFFTDPATTSVGVLAFLVGCHSRARAG